MLLGDVIDENARRYPAKEAICFEGSRITFLQFRERVYRAANALLSVARRGDRVAVLAENCHQYAELYFAAPCAGMILVPVNYRLSEREMAFVINDSGARVLIVSDDYADRVESFRSDIPDVEQFLCIGTPPQGMIDYEDFITRFIARRPPVAPDENDTAWFIYTSGTTGFPKGGNDNP